MGRPERSVPEPLCHRRHRAGGTGRTAGQPNIEAVSAIQTATSSDIMTIPALAALAHAHVMPLLVDSTVATPALLRTRMDAWSRATFRVARFLEAHPAIAHVAYSGLASHPATTSRRAISGSPTATRTGTRSPAWER
jgi:O-acetylhomoserine/O-acetylserine sulfhydrylase-like pyridoxal-dependent enzyme